MCMERETRGPLSQNGELDQFNTKPSRISTVILSGELSNTDRLQRKKNTNNYFLIEKKKKRKKKQHKHCTTFSEQADRSYHVTASNHLVSVLVLQPRCRTVMREKLKGWEFLKNNLRTTNV